MDTKKLRNVFSASTDKGVEFAGTKSLAKQSHKAECDINNIMARYRKTGILPELIRQNPQYGDFSDAADYRESLHIVMRANEQFQGLPSAVRERFSNDPARFLEFCSKKENREEMAKLGLLKPEVLEEIRKAQTPPEVTPEAPGGSQTPENPPKNPKK